MVELIIEKLLWFLNRWQNRESLKTFGAIRSNQWPKIRKIHLEKFPNCALCGGNKIIEVHHIIPFNIDPSKELDPSNLITLCESGKNGIVCHRSFGHLGNYQSFNTEVIKDAETWKEKLDKRP